MALEKTKEEFEEEAEEGLLTYVSPHDGFLKKSLIHLLELCSGKPMLQRKYQILQNTELEPRDVWKGALDHLNMHMDYSQEQLEKIPKTGPLVVISNHPFGIVDGLIVGHMVTRVRDDFLVLVNEVLLRQDKRLNRYLLPIDFRENKAALKNNLATRQHATAYLKDGGALIIFPAGGISTSPRGFGKAVDLEWKRFTAKVIQQAKATVVPFFVHGQNSRLFQLVSQVSLTLRLGLLLHETRNKMGDTVRIDIGAPISFDNLAAYKDRQKLIEYLREVTYALERG